METNEAIITKLAFQFILQIHNHIFFKTKTPTHRRGFEYLQLSHLLYHHKT
jgi:hypothetical protein